MRQRLATPSGSLHEDSERIIRLLSLYRVVAAVGAFALLMWQPGSISVSPYSLAFIAIYVIVHIVVLINSPQILKHKRTSLTALALFDIVFLVLISSLGGSLLFAAASLPVLITHGWLLRDRLAIAHAGFTALSILLVSNAISFPINQAAFIGIGALGATVLGIFLGRTSTRAMALADQRGEDLEQLAALNQSIIDEIDQGILVVDNTGVLLQANPQAERWLYAAGVPPRLPQALVSISQSLSTHLDNWRNGLTILDSGITLGTGELLIRVRARFLSTELRRAGDTVIFLEDLRVAQQQAQQIKLAALGRLTANIAHEIRNPLSAIRQSGQLLSESDTSAANVRLTEMIEKNVRRIDRIITNVLSLSKRDRVIPHTHSAEKILFEIARDWLEQMQAGPGVLKIDVEPNLSIRADLGHIEEIVWNLLGNAFRHSTKGMNSVQLHARRSASQRVAIIEVTDDGNGVPVEHRESVFEPFFSLSGSSGLGLYISRELAESNGGMLELTAHEPGAQFRLILPTVLQNEFE